MRQKSTLTAAEAQQMIAAAKIEAAKNNWIVSVAVVDEAGYLLHLERMDGAVLQSPEVATRKARTAALSRRPTKALEDTVKDRPVMLLFPLVLCCLPAFALLTVAPLLIATLSHVRT